MNVTKQVPNEILLPIVREEIAAGKSVTLIVRGNSMNPFLVDRRDKVTIAPFTFPQPQLGDFVLAYEADTGRYLLHRFVRRASNGDCILLGDGNLKGTTERILPTDMIGVVTEMQRKGTLYSTSSRTWRCYSFLWKLLTPLRRYPLGAWRRLFLKHLYNEEERRIYST